MNHLTDEQYEDYIQGRIDVSEHVDQCPDCHNRLAEKKALAGRLRKAFGSVRASGELRDRIEQEVLKTKKPSQPAKTEQRPFAFRMITRYWPRLAAAAAILVVAIPLGVYFSSASRVHAAQAALVEIHHHNLDPHEDFFSEDEPEKLAEYFRDKLGFSPVFPCVGQGLAVRGCCIKHFRGQMVGSYVVDTPRGVISVIVVTDTPKSMGMKRMARRADSGGILWKASFARCSMITIRLGDYSYCAVGEVSHELLENLLARLLP